jgi:hypothetical protein
MKLEFSQQIFEKYWYIKFHIKPVQWNPSCSMRTDGQTDLTKLIVGFHNSVNAPTNEPRPSRLMDWWTRFITLSITRTWQVIRHFFLQTILVWSRVSLPNVFETLFFWNSPIKRKRKSTYGASGPVRKCRHKRRRFGKVCKANECTVDTRPQSRASMTSLAEPMANLFSMLFSNCPSFGVNQNYDLKPLHLVYLVRCHV